MLKSKKIGTVILCFCILICSAISAYGENTTSRITDICVLKGNLYYCDHESGKIVMKNVSPVMESEVGNEIAKAIEYTEIGISAEAMYMKDGTKAEYDWLNNNADDVAQIIVARQEDGNMRVMYFQFK